MDWSGNALTYNGSSWSSPKSIDASENGLRSLSCPTTSFCAAVDVVGNALTYKPQLVGLRPTTSTRIEFFLTPLLLVYELLRCGGGFDGNVFTYSGASSLSPRAPRLSA